MRSLARPAALAAALLILVSCGQMERGVREVHTLAEAKTMAGKEGDFIVAEFYSPT